MQRVAVVLAGGRASRMGLPKQALLREGQSLLVRAVDALCANGCERVAVVARPGGVPDTLAARPEVLVTLEDPPDGGPVAGIAAALAAVAVGQQDEVLVLACDLPAADVLVARLVAEPFDASADVLAPIDADGWVQWLAARYRAGALGQRLAALASVRDLSVRRAMSPLRAQLVELGDDLLRDVDTPSQAQDAGLRAPDGRPIANQEPQ